MIIFESILESIGKKNSRLSSKYWSIKISQMLRQRFDAYKQEDTSYEFLSN